MFHAIIYDNRTSNGYTFYEETPSFPDEFRSPIKDICHLYSEPATNNTSVRYAPLGDGAYLLSVVFRVSGSEHQLRRHFHIVHFLMDKTVAEDFFSTPFCTDALISFAESCYQEKLKNFSGNWDAYRSSSGSTVSNTSNIRGETLYSCYLPKKFQLFVGMEFSGDADINYLMQTLPYAMRPSLSFAIGMETAKECRKIRFNFGTISDIQQLQSSGYNGCIGTDKYTLFIHDGKITSFGVEPSQTEQQVAAKFLTLIEAPYYPVLRYLIRNREALAEATEDLAAYLKTLRSVEVSTAIGKAQSNNEISAEVATAFRNLYSKTKKSPFANFVKGFFSPAPAPVQNPGRNANNTAANIPDKAAVQSDPSNLPQTAPQTNHTGTPAPSEILSIEPKETLADLDSTTMRPNNLLQSGSDNDQTPSPAPSQPGQPGPENSTQKQTGDTKPSQPTRSKPWTKGFSIGWLSIVLLGLAVFCLTMALSMRISAMPSETLGLFIITVDGAVTIVSNILSYLCGGITVYALIRLFRHKKK